MDLAHLGIKVEYKDIEKAITKLKELKKVATEVEKTPVSFNPKATKKAQADIEKGIKSIKERYTELSKINLFELSKSQVDAFLKELNKVNLKLFELRKSLKPEDYKLLSQGVSLLQNKAKTVKNLTEEYHYADVATKQYHKDLVSLNLTQREIATGIKKIIKQFTLMSHGAGLSSNKLKNLTAQLRYFESEANKLGKHQNISEIENLLQIAKAKQGIASSLIQAEEARKLSSLPKKGLSTLKEWWVRFGAVGVGFTVIYQTINLVKAALTGLGSIVKEGIQQSGELASTQAKLALWIQMATKNAISYSGAMRYASKQTMELSDASLRSISTLSELSAALDELGQAQVILTPKEMRDFADLVDFTKLVAETTGSTVRQIRQEIQALMQGQMKTTNILIRTAKSVGILTDEDIQKLKNMEDRHKILAKLSHEIAIYWERVKKYIMTSDVNMVFEKWRGGIIRLISKSVQLVSARRGVTNIFGETIFKHFEKLTKEINRLSGTEYEGGLLFLNSVLDKFLTLTENAVIGTLKFANNLQSLSNPLNIVTSGIKTLVKDIRGLLNGFNALIDKTKNLKSPGLIGKGLAYGLEYKILNMFIKNPIISLATLLTAHVGKNLLQAPNIQFGGINWEQAWKEYTTKQKQTRKSSTSNIWDELKKESNARLSEITLMGMIPPKVPQEIRDFANTFLESIKTPEEKYSEYVSKLKSALKFNLISREDYLKGLAVGVDKFGLGYSPDMLEAKAKGMEDAKKRAQTYLKEILDVKQKFTDDYNKLTMSQYDYEIYSLNKTLEEYRKNGISEIELEKYKIAALKKINEEYEKARLQNSRKWTDGAIRALQAYGDTATNVAKNVEVLFTDAFSNIENALVNMVKTGKLQFKSLIDSMISDIARLTIRQTITGPLAQALSYGIQSWASSLGDTLYYYKTGTYYHQPTVRIDTSTGQTIATGLHSGGKVGEGSGFYRNVPSSLFINAPRLHNGLLPGEYPAILKKGESVIPENSSLVDVKIIDQRQSFAPPIEVNKKQTSDGRTQIRIIVKSEIKNMIGTGELDSLFKQTYGLQRKGY